MSRKPVHWQGNSHPVITGFSEDARENLGNDLRRVQEGLQPLDSKPMGAVLPGCYEPRDADEGVIYVLHCFTKKTSKTPQNDISTADKRLKELKRRLAKEKDRKR